MLGPLGVEEWAGEGGSGTGDHFDLRPTCLEGQIRLHSFSSQSVLLLWLGNINTRVGS